MKDVDALEAQPRQAAFQRFRHRLLYAAEIGFRQPDLGADDRAGRLQRLQNAAEILFRFAVAILHSGVEVIDAGGDRPRNGALLVVGLATHHDSAHRAAAKAEHRELHSGAPEIPQLHRGLLDRHAITHGVSGNAAPKRKSPRHRRGDR